MPSQAKQITQLQAQVADLTAKFEAVTSQMDLDTGITDTDYGAVGDIISNNPVTVWNTSKNVFPPGGTMLKFEDASGKEWLVSPGKIIEATGLTTGMQSLIDRGLLTPL